jgi:hypothetical protein
MYAASLAATGYGENEAGEYSICLSMMARQLVAF